MSRAPIAITGLGCRLPGGANDPDAFWQLLAEARSGVTEVPPDRWDAAALHDPDPQAPGKIVSRQGGFLDDVRGFDAGFFRISPREAARMDPQQRLFLEVAWEAFEDAGQPREQLAGSRTGVFAGVMGNDYAGLHARQPQALDGHCYAGYSFVPNRVSHFLDLRGPSVAIDSACSSSLTALHLACRSLRDGECDLALVGGVNLMLSPDLSITFSKWGMLSPGGACRTFAADADGFVRGEGCIAMVLKRASEAVRDGDRVRALVRGTAVGQDGRTTVFTAPNGLAQRAVIRAALADAGIPSEAVGYVEAHGTGTPLGDPIELEALAAEYGAPGPGRCLVGAVKTNVGHLEGAAGLAGLLKAVLCLEREAIPPNLNFGQLNPHIALTGTRLELALALTPWPRTTGPRLAAVSAFGAGGTNAHVIVAEAATATNARQTVPTGQYLLPLSAHTTAALEARAAALANALDRGLPPADTCFTAGTRRTHLPVRAVACGDSAAGLAAALRAVRAGNTPARATRPTVVFVYWSQDSRRASTDPGPEQRIPGLESPAAAGPAGLSALQASLTEAWRACGIEPDVVVDHSAGQDPAQFTATIAALAARPGTVFVAVGPVPVLRKAILESAATAGAEPPVLWCTLREGTAPEQCLADGLAKLYRLGCQVNWTAFMPAGRVESLPPYPFQRQPYWIGDTPEPPRGLDGTLPGRELSSPALLGRVFEQRLSPASAGGHRVNGRSLAPFSLLAVLAMAAARREHGTAARLAGLRLYRALDLDLGAVDLQTVLGPGGTRVAVHARRDGEPWTEIGAAAVEAAPPLAAEPLPVVRARCTQAADSDRFHDTLVRGGLEYADAFRCVEEIYHATGEALARIRSAPGATLAALDGALRVLLAAAGSTGPAPVPVAVGQAAFGELPDGFWAHARAVRRDGSAGTVVLYADDGAVLGVLREIQLAAPVEAGIPIYRTRWRRVPSGQRSPETGRLLVVGDDDGLAGRLGAAVGGRGALAKRPEDVPACLPEREPATLVQLATTADDAERTCRTTLELIQAVLQAAPAVPPRLWLVTRGAVATATGEAASLAGGAARGLGRAIRLELPDLWGGLIDLDPVAQPDEVERLLDLIDGAPEDDLALRAGLVLAPRLVAAAASGGPPLDKDGLYLVTGGGGALGRALAGWLRERGAGRVVLAGRTAVRRVDTVQLDVTDAAAVSALIKDLRRAQPPLRGVFHLAGVADDAVLPGLSWERFERVLAPKVRGASNLHQATSGLDLDHFVLFSSIASLLGSPGQGAYAAANGFLDALAAHRRSLGLPGLSVQFGPWAGDGMAARAGAALERQWTGRGVTLLEPAAALRSLDRLLGGMDAQAAIVQADWTRLAQTLRRPALLTDLAESPAVPAPSAAAASATVDSMAAGSLEERVGALAAKVLGLPGGQRPDRAASLFSQGLDSLLALQLRTHLQEVVGLSSLPVTFLFDHPSISALVRALEKLRAEVPA
jgi:acyl transferase domain-containing protein